ncbi:DNA-directed RNA polymerases IV and V subunit 2-like protein [Tanacetum coccineum]
MKDNLDDDGFPYDGARLNSGDIIIGKHAEEGADHSIKLKHGEKGYVQKVVLSANDDGEKVESLMFMGLTFYQKLVHVSEDKVRYRNKCHVYPLTRQPVADRKRFGGVKFGDLERDCICDASHMHICRKSKNMIVVTNGWNAILPGLDIAHPVAKSMIELTHLGMRKLVTELHQSLVYGVLFEGDFHRQMVVNNHYKEWSWIDFHTLLRRSHFCPFLVFEKDDALSWNGTNENMHEHGEDDPQDALEALRKKRQREIEISLNFLFIFWIGELKKTTEDFDDFLGKLITGGYVANDEILGLICKVV